MFYYSLILQSCNHFCCMKEIMNFRNILEHFVKSIDCEEMISSVFSSIPEEYISPLIQNISSKSESNDSKTGVCVCLTPEDADECEQERDNGEVERGQNQTTWRGQHVARPELGTWHVACHLDPHDADDHAKCFPANIYLVLSYHTVIWLVPKKQKVPNINRVDLAVHSTSTCDMWEAF